MTPGEGTQVTTIAIKKFGALPTSGTSVFNVTPLKAGKYFSKIQCFCFDEQTLAASEEVDMDLVFFVDPAMFDDGHPPMFVQIAIIRSTHVNSTRRCGLGGRLRPRFLHVSPGNRTDESRRWELRCGGPSFMKTPTARVWTHLGS